MDVNVQNPLDSDSTFCSEVELTGATRKNHKSSSQLRWAKSTETRCTGSKNYYIDSEANDFRNGFVSQKINSSPLLTCYTESQASFPLSQALKNITLTGSVSMHSRPNTQSESSKNQLKTYLPMHSYKNKLKSDYLNKIEAWKAINFKGPQNKIFPSADQKPLHLSYTQINRGDDFDTASISSENVSKIVDKEIAIYRKRRQLKGNPSQRCPCLSQMLKSNFNQPCSQIGRQHMISSLPENEKKHLSYTKAVAIQQPKHYKLTQDHIQKVAGYFQIDSSRLTIAIERVLEGQDLEQLDDDDCDEINCSQSPIKRRYSNSQLTDASNASK